MGSSYFRAYPRVQALALPPYKDKQRSQPTPSDYIGLMPYVYIIYRYSISMDIMHPRRRSVALPLCTVSSLLSLNTQNSNVRKRLSRSRPYNWFSRLRFLLMSFDLPCSFVPAQRAALTMDWLSQLQMYDYFLSSECLQEQKLAFALEKEGKKACFDHHRGNKEGEGAA